MNPYLVHSYGLNTTVDLSLHSWEVKTLRERKTVEKVKGNHPTLIFMKFIENSQIRLGCQENNRLALEWTWHLKI